MTDEVKDLEDDAEVVEDSISPSRFQTLKNEILQEAPTVAELKAYAKEHDVGLEGATVKVEIIETITAALLIRQDTAAEDAEISGDNNGVVNNESASQVPQNDGATAPPELVDQTPETNGAEPPTIVDPEVESNEEVNPVRQPNQPLAAHWKRLVIPTSEANQKFADANVEADTVQSAKAYIEDYYFANGFELDFVSYIGTDTLSEVSGHNIMFLFTRPTEREAKHSEIYFIIAQVAGYSGFQADTFVSSYIQQGWQLKHFETLGFSESGINCFWVLVR